MVVAVVLIVIVLGHLLDQVVQLSDLRSHQLYPEPRRRRHRWHVHLYARATSFCSGMYMFVVVEQNKDNFLDKKLLLLNREVLPFIISLKNILKNIRY